MDESPGPTTQDIQDMRSNFSTLLKCIETAESQLADIQWTYAEISSRIEEEQVRLESLLELTAAYENAPQESLDIDGVQTLGEAFKTAEQW